MTRQPRYQGTDEENETLGVFSGYAAALLAGFIVIIRRDA